MRCPMSNEDALHRLLTAFFDYERPEVRDFREAVELFKQDIPSRESINQGITGEDVREMIIQHILTEDIFNTIFDENQFHRENNIARELEAVILTFFTGSLRRATLLGVKHYYDVINAAASRIADHHEKQKFLKVVYETFYKSYNPKAPTVWESYTRPMKLCVS